MPFFLVLLIYNTCLLLYYPNIPILPSCHIIISSLHFLIRCLQFLCRPPLHILQKIKTKLMLPHFLHHSIYTSQSVLFSGSDPCLIVSSSTLISGSDPLITRIELISQYNKIIFSRYFLIERAPPPSLAQFLQLTFKFSF